MGAAILPLGIYFVSACLLYLETCLIASAMAHLRHAPHGGRRNLAVLLLLVPLVLLPAVPIVLLFTLDYDCRATPRTLLYAVVLWVVGLGSAIPAYLYAKRLKRRRAPV